jgi:hypothetical protein
MNVAHFMGEHSFNSIWGTIMHYISNWVSFVLAIILVLVAVKAFKTPAFQEIMERIRRKG